MRHEPLYAFVVRHSPSKSNMHAHGVVGAGQGRRTVHGPDAVDRRRIKARHNVGPGRCGAHFRENGWLA